MQIKKLPKKDREALDSAFRSCKNAKEQNRVQVIRLLSQAYSHESVRQIIGYSGSQIRQLVTRYNKVGIEGLRFRPAVENRSKLSRIQKNKIKEILQSEKTPFEAGLKVRLDQDFWSLTTLRQLVKKMYKVTYRSETIDKMIE